LFTNGRFGLGWTMLDTGHLGCSAHSGAAHPIPRATTTFRRGAPATRHLGPPNLEMDRFWAVHRVVGIRCHVPGSGCDYKGFDSMEVQTAQQTLVLSSCLIPHVPIKHALKKKEEAAGQRLAGWPSLGQTRPAGRTYDARQGYGTHLTGHRAVPCS
jgi:hypothetical protein